MEHARFRTMSPPIPYNYVASTPPPRASSTPPVHLEQHSSQMDRHDYNQLLMGVNQMNLQEKVEALRNLFVCCI